jgi:transcriptional regulator with XRE-family HTH domain
MVKVKNHGFAKAKGRRRRQLDMTQEELARRTKNSKALISGFLNRERGLPKGSSLNSDRYWDWPA